MSAASSSSTTIGDNDPQIKYQGKWTPVTNPPGFHLNSLTYTTQVEANATFTFTGQFVGIYGVIPLATQSTPNANTGTHSTCIFDDLTSEVFGDNNTLKPGTSVQLCSTAFPNDGVHTVVLINHGSSLWLNYISYGALPSPPTSQSISPSRTGSPSPAVSLPSVTPSSHATSKVAMVSRLSSLNKTVSAQSAPPTTPFLTTFTTTAITLPLSPFVSATEPYNVSDPTTEQPSSSATSTFSPSTSPSASRRDSTSVSVSTIIGATLGTLVLVVGIACFAWAWRARQRTRRLNNANAFARLDHGATPGQMPTGATETGTTSEKTEKRKKQMENSRHMSGASSFAPTLPRYGYVYRESQILEGSDVVVRDGRPF